MSLYHFHVTQIKRSKGYSAMAAAVYRAGEKLYCDYYGETFDFTRKKGVLHSEIILPENTPEEFRDRQFLWDSVESNEKHPKAQLAYSFDIALQNEFTIEENIKLAREFILENFTKKGMIADWAVHQPDKRKGQIPNPHFHVLCPMRRLNKDGKWEAKQKREYVLDGNGNRVKDRNGKDRFNAVPTTDWGSPESLRKWRKNWEAKVNDKFREKGLESCFIDCGSYEDRNIDKIPQIHEGAAARRMEEKGIPTDKVSYNRWVKATSEALRKVAEEIRSIREMIKRAKCFIEELKKEVKELLEEDPTQLTVPRLVGEYLKHRNKVAETYKYGQDKAKTTNLKAVASMYCYVQDKKIVTLDDLKSAIRDYKERSERPLSAYYRQQERTEEARKLYLDAKAVNETKQVYEEYKCIFFKGRKKKYYEEHKKELDRCFAARNTFSGWEDMPDKKITKSLHKQCMEEKERLDGMESEYRRYKDEAAILREIQKAIKASIEDRKKAGKPSEIARSPKTETEKKKLIKPEDRESVRAKLEKGKDQKRQEERQLSERHKKKSIDREM